MLVRFLVVVLLGCGPVGPADTPAECPPENAEGLAHEPRVQVRLVNEGDSPLVIEDHFRSVWPRYFDVEGVADGRALRGPESTCRATCADVIAGFYDCDGIALSGAPIYLPPATAHDLSWTVELEAEHELAAECTHDGMPVTCGVTTGAWPGDYSIRARSLSASTCDTRDWACEDDQALGDEACRLRETVADPTCDAGPEASAAWDGASEIVLVFE